MQRELERTRDMVAEAAAPVMAEKIQEAIAETSDRLTTGPTGERMRGQARNVATAMQHDATQAAKDRAQEALGRVEDRANQAMDRAASGLQQAARKIDEVADRQTAGATGKRAQVGAVAHNTADTLDSVARYLRDNDAQQLQQDLQAQVRTNPLQTLLIAVAAGWVIGKILR